MLAASAASAADDSRADEGYERQIDTLMDAPVDTSNPVPVLSKLDERVWQAWIQKNRERDRVHFERRVKVLKYFLFLLASAALIWKYTT